MLVVAAIVVLPLCVAYVGAHVGPARCPPPRLGAAHEDVALRTSDGLRLSSWCVPSRNHAAVIVFPGRSGRGRPQVCSPVTGTGCCSTTVAGRVAARAPPTPGAGTSIGTSAPASSSCGAPSPTWIRGGSAAWGLWVRGEMMLADRRRDGPTWPPSSPEGAGARTMREEVEDVSGLAKVPAALSLRRARPGQRRPPRPRAAGRPARADPRGVAAPGVPDPRRRGRRGASRGPERYRAARGSRSRSGRRRAATRRASSASPASGSVASPASSTGLCWAEVASPRARALDEAGGGPRPGRVEGAERGERHLDVVVDAPELERAVGRDQRVGGARVAVEAACRRCPG